MNGTRSDLLWGIDLGGTKIEGIVARSSSLTEPIARYRIDTEAAGGYDHILSRITQVVTELERLSGATAQRVGVGTPGTIDPGLDALKNSNTLCLNKRPVHRDLETLLKRPVRLMNDANCFALAEARFGAAQGKSVVFGVILGTGVGGGVVINGNALVGAHGIAGEWGHNVLDPAGEPCYCGKRGCIERVLSGPALEGYYQQRSGTQLRLREIAAAATAGNATDAIAVETIERLVTGLGKALAGVINILDPDVVILGGGVSNTAAIYPRIHQAILPWIFNHEVRTPVLPAQLGDSAGVFGAALLSE